MKQESFKTSQGIKNNILLIKILICLKKCGIECSIGYQPDVVM